ncbi:MAG: hypothetical protein ACRDJL_03850, partial [Actinomycetota bacterium]
MAEVKWSLVLAGLLVMSACADGVGSSAPIRATEPVYGEEAASPGEAPADEMPLAYSNKRARKHVRALARDIGPRVRTKRSEWRASKYIRQRFKSFGYETKVQKF